MHIIAENADKMTHLFFPYVAHICNSECVNVSKLSWVNCKAKAASIVVKFVKVVFRRFRNKDSSDEVALIFFFHKHFQTDFFQSLYQDFPTSSETFKTLLNSFDFCLYDSI